MLFIPYIKYTDLCPCILNTHSQWLLFWYFVPQTVYVSCIYYCNFVN